MLFWILAGLMTAGVMLMIARPLLTRAHADTASRGAYDLEVYRDQLAELERDLARGLITAEQAAAAKAEIGRRMLAVAAAEKAAKKAGTAAPTRGKALALLLAVAVPVGAFAVYAPLGRPDLPALPLAARDLDKERGLEAPPQVMEAVRKLKEHLAKNPSDAQGWVMMGQTYARIGRYDEAADAMKRAADLRPGDPETVAAYAEMVIAANDGTVPMDAKRSLEQVLAKNPSDPRARYYLGLAAFQGGDVQGAFERWRALMAETPADAPWLPMVRARLTEAAQALRLDVNTAIPAPLPAQAQAPAPQPQGQAQQAPHGEDDNAAMIRGMVETLAGKLKANPADVNGWLMLARSYNVLGEPDNAIAAAREAVQRAPDRADVQLSYAEALLGRVPEGAPMPAEAVQSLRQVLAIEADNKDALWLLGLDAAQAGRKDEATALWTRLLSQIDPKDPGHEIVRQRIAGLKTGS